jgi:hypothetical protein
MACFVAPLGEAVVTTIIQKIVENKEKKTGVKQSEKTGLTWSRKLSWLNKMLWGGSILLAFEHLWHGEIVPWFPFLTAMQNPADTALMLREIATIGVSMAVLVTIVWGIIVIIADAKAKTTPVVKTRPVSGGA